MQKILTILLCLYNPFIAFNVFSYTVHSSSNWSPQLLKMNLERIMDWLSPCDGLVDSYTFYLAYSVFTERFMTCTCPVI